MAETFRELPDEPPQPVRPQAVQDPEPTRRAMYTWLHMIVLVLVAFVLGMLVWMIINRDAPGATENAAGPSTGVMAAVDTPTQAEGAASGGD